MNIIALCIIPKYKDPLEEKLLFDEHLKAIKNKYIDKEIIKVYHGYDHQMESTVKEAIDHCSKQNLLLVCKRSTPISGDFDSLTYLKRCKIDFDFMDFPALQFATLDAVIGLLNHQKLSRSQNIKRGIASAKRSGKKMGNPRLLESEAIKHATERRKTLALYDNNNIKARKEIAHLVENKKMNFTKIMHHLNENDFKTRRGKKFHTRTVTRLYEKYLDLKSLFQPYPKFEKWAQPRKNFHQQDHILRATNWTTALPNFTDSINISLNDNLKLPVEVTIYNNQEDVVHKKTYYKDQREITIDVTKEEKLLPGKYYLQLSADGMDSFFKPFHLHENLVLQEHLNG